MRMQNAKEAQRDNGQCLPDYAASPNRAYLKNTGALGYLFCAYWATSGDELLSHFVRSNN